MSAFNFDNKKIMRLEWQGRIGLTNLFCQILYVGTCAYVQYLPLLIYWSLEFFKGAVVWYFFSLRFFHQAASSGPIKRYCRSYFELYDLFIYLFHFLETCRSLEHRRVRKKCKTLKMYCFSVIIISYLTVPLKEIFRHHLFEAI